MDPQQTPEDKQQLQRSGPKVIQPLSPSSSPEVPATPAPQSAPLSVSTEKIIMPPAGSQAPTAPAESPQFVQPITPASAMPPAQTSNPLPPPAVVPQLDASPITVPTLSAMPAYVAEKDDESSSKVDWIITFVLTIVGGVGPGLILAGIILAIKGAVKSQRSLIKFGLSCVVIGSLITGAAYYFLYANKGTNVTLGSHTINTELPEELKKIDSMSSDKTVGYGILKPGKTDDYKGQVSFVQSDFSGEGGNAKNAEVIDEFVQSSSYAGLLKEQISTLCSNVKVAPAEKANVTGSVSSYKSDFVCDEGSKSESVGGTIVEIFAEKHVYTVTVIAEKETWMAKSQQWDAIAQNLSIKAN